MCRDGIAHEHRDGHRPDAARHWRDPARDFFDALGVDVSDDRRRAIGVSHLVDADVDDRGAGLHHVRMEKLRLAHGDKHGIRAARVRSHRTRQMVAHRYGGAFGHQHERRRLSHDLGVADHHDLEPVQRESRRFDQLDRRRCRARRERQVVVDDVADRRRVHAFEVLERVNRGRQRASVDVRRHRALQNHAEDVAVVVHRDETRLAFFLRQRRRPDLFFETQSDFFRRIRLAAHVYRRRFVRADAHGDKTSNRMRRRRAPHAFGDVIENAIAHGSPVEKAMVSGGHRNAQCMLFRMTRKILIAGGGFVSPPFIRYMARLTGKPRPRVCYLPTAVGDHPDTIINFYKSCAALDVTPLVQASFIASTAQRESWDEALLSMDAIVASGGNTLNQQAIWRAQGIDVVLRQAWERGIVLGGSSAGSLCWFEEGTTDSRPKELSIVQCLGFLKGSHCPHYDAEPARRPLYLKLVGSGQMKPGYAVDNDAGIYFEDNEVKRVVASRAGSKAYYVSVVDGAVVERELSPERIDT